MEDRLTRGFIEKMQARGQEGYLGVVADGDGSGAIEPGHEARSGLGDQFGKDFRAGVLDGVEHTAHANSRVVIQRGGQVDIMWAHADFEFRALG
jgi:hypothetical protein